MTEIDADLAKALSEEKGSWRMVAARHALTIMRLRAEAKELADALENDLNDGDETKVSLRTLNALRVIQSRDEQSGESK